MHAFPFPGRRDGGREKWAAEPARSREWDREVSRKSRGLRTARRRRGVARRIRRMHALPMNVDHHYVHVPLGGETRHSVRALEAGRAFAQGMPEQCLLHRVRSAARVLNRLYDSVTWHEHRVTQMHLMAAVRGNRNRCISQVAASLSMSRPTLSRALKRMALAGLVRCRRGSDGRTKIPFLTPRGERYFLIFSRMWKSARDWMEQVLPSDLRERLLAVCRETEGRLSREVRRLRLGKPPYFTHG